MADDLQLKEYSCTLTSLTPVHIGSGVEIPPHEYVVKDGIFYRIDIYSIYDSLNEKEKAEFLTYAEKDIKSLRTYVANIYKKEMGYIYCANTDKAFQTLYREKLSGARNANEENSLIVKEFAGSMNGKYVPGSSIKGAMRSAYLYNNIENIDYPISRKKHSNPKVPPKYVSGYNRYEDNDKDKSMSLNALMLKRFSPFSDPFKYLRVSDVFSQNLSIFIGRMNRCSYNKKLNKFLEGPSEIVEMLQGEISHNFATPLSFTMSVKNFNDKTGMKWIYSSRKLNSEMIGPKKPEFSDKVFIKALNKKFHDVLENEIAYYRKNRKDEVVKVLEKIEKEFKSLKENEAIFRLGKGSGFISFTHLLKNKQFKEDLNPASRVLAEGLYPMGWCKIKFE